MISDGDNIQSLWGLRFPRGAYSPSGLVKLRDEWTVLRGPTWLSLQNLQIALNIRIKSDVRWKAVAGYVWPLRGERGEDSWLEDNWTIASRRTELSSSIQVHTAVKGTDEMKITGSFDSMIDRIQTLSRIDRLSSKWRLSPGHILAYCGCFWTTNHPAGSHGPPYSQSVASPAPNPSCLSLRSISSSLHITTAGTGTEVYNFCGCKILQFFWMALYMVGKLEVGAVVMHRLVGGANGMDGKW